MNTARLITSLKAEEGFRALPYKDSEGYWTIGIGTCLERVAIEGLSWKALLDAGLIELKIKPAGAQLLLQTHLYHIENALSETLPDWYTIDEPRRHVLMQMAYQMGTGFIYKFPRFTAAVNARDWKAAKLHGLDSKWAREQTPARAKRMMDKLESGAW
jgi:lysozyme